jgi:hypothetical protein
MEQNKNESKSNGETKQENCPVCLENPATKTTKCEHKFCSPCLDAWSAANNSCPLCRSKLNNSFIARSDDNYSLDYLSAINGNYSRIDTIPDLEIRFHPDLFVEEPFRNAPIFNTNNLSVVIPRWPAELRGTYVRLEFPSISDTQVSGEI